MDALRLIDTWDVDAAAAALLRDDGSVSTHGDTSRPFRWASVTKLVTALATLVALEEGTLELDTPAGPPGSTVRHLLAHASGMSFEGEGLMGLPGERRVYSNPGFNALGAALASAAGMPFHEYVQAAVFAPLSMGDSSLRLDEKYGVPAAGGSGPLGDVVALARELMQPTLIAEETLAEAATVTFPGLDGVIPGFGRQTPCDWGLGFEIRSNKSPHWTGADNSPRTYGHFGGSGTFLWVDPEAACALVCLTNRTFDDWAKEAWPPFADAVLAEVADEPASAERSAGP
ncbi:MAG: serine hydrolase domain-containing protein [Gaiellaceae bacterium]